MEKPSGPRVVRTQTGGLSGLALCVRVFTRATSLARRSRLRLWLVCPRYRRFRPPHLASFATNLCIEACPPGLFNRFAPLTANFLIKSSTIALPNYLTSFATCFTGQLGVCRKASFFAMIRRVAVSSNGTLRCSRFWLRSKFFVCHISYFLYGDVFYKKPFFPLSKTIVKQLVLHTHFRYGLLMEGIRNDIPDTFISRIHRDVDVSFVLVNITLDL